MTEAKWLEGNDVRGMLLYLATSASERKCLLFASQCCRRLWDRFADPRTCRVVECAELRADGVRTSDELQFAYEEATKAWQDAMESADQAERDAYAAGLTNKYTCPTYGEARRKAWAADPGQYFFYKGTKLADYVAASVRGVAGDVAMMAYFAVSPQDNPERLWQGTLLNEMFGNPFRPVAFDPAWRSDTAVPLAKHIYEARDFSAMPILADALQDAGCEREAVLAHCRDPQQVHVRGCWVVDLVLGKE